MLRFPSDPSCSATEFSPSGSVAAIMSSDVPKNRSSANLRKRGLVTIDGATALIVLQVIVQIWLLSAALESLLAGHSETALPAAVFSGLLFISCVALTLFVLRVDRESRGQ